MKKYVKLCEKCVGQLSDCAETNTQIFVYLTFVDLQKKNMTYEKV
jgi:hypothetical protein